MDYDKTTDLILKAAAYAGQAMLESGAETYRVEDTISRILTAYGGVSSDSFVTPTGITISCDDNNGRTQTVVKRIRKISVDLERISLINDLSRSINADGLSPEEFRLRLDDILTRQRYTLQLTLLAAAMIGSSSTLMNGGTVPESLGAGIAAPLAYIAQKLASTLGLNHFLQNSLGGTVAVLTGALLKTAGLLPEYSLLVIGTIMILVPGVTITNAIRDTFQGDYISGVARAVEALVTASGIAFGAGIAFLLLGVMA